MQRRRSVSEVMLLEGRTHCEVLDGLIKSLEFVRNEVESLGMTETADLIQQARKRAYSEFWSTRSWVVADKSVGN